MDLLFNSDPYLKHCEAKILDIQDGSLVLDRTIFFPLGGCLLYTSPSPRDATLSRMPSSG